MATKRSQKMVVRTTRKVVQQSVQVSVVGSNKRLTRGKNKQELFSSGQEYVRNIPVEEVTPQAAQSQGGDQNDIVYEAEEAKKEASTSQEKKRKRGRRSDGEYQIYVYRVLKQVHPEIEISSKAMTILNNLMTDMLERLANEAARLNKYAGQITLSPRDIQGAAKLVLPGELGKHALAEGAKAVTTYMSNHC